MTTATLPAPVSPSPAPAGAGRTALDAAIAELAAHKQAWTAVPIAERIALLEELIPGFLGVAERWTQAGLEAEGLDPASPPAAEEWLTGPFFIVRNLRLFIRSLRDLE